MKIRIFTILKFHPGGKEKIHQFGFIDLDATAFELEQSVLDI